MRPACVQAAAPLQSCRVHCRFAFHSAWPSLFCSSHRLHGDPQQLQQQMMDVDAQSGLLGAGHGDYVDGIR